ncbi:MAG: PEP-CTERM sorting domain-containing protein [Verrucomicrobiota bacterium]
MKTQISLSLTLFLILSEASSQFVETTTYEDTWSRNSNYDYRFKYYEKERAQTDIFDHPIIGDFEKYKYRKTLQYYNGSSWKKSSYTSDNVKITQNQTDGWEKVGDVSFADHWRSRNNQSRYLRGSGTRISNLESAVNFESGFLDDVHRGSVIFQEFTFHSAGSIWFDFGMWNDIHNDDFAFYSISKLDAPGGNVVSVESEIIMDRDIYNALDPLRKISGYSNAAELFDQSIELRESGTYQIAFGVAEEAYDDKHYGYDPHFKIDNIRYWPTGGEQIPEPSTWGLIGSGFLGIVIISRKLRKSRKYLHKLL